MLFGDGLLDIVEDLCQLRGAGGRIVVVAGGSVAQTPIPGGIRIIARDAVHELIGVAGGRYARRRIRAIENADGVHRGAGIFQFLGFFDGGIRNVVIKTTPMIRLAISEENHVFLRSGTAAGKRLLCNLHCSIGIRCASRLQTIDACLQQASIRRKLLYNLCTVTRVRLPGIAYSTTISACRGPDLVGIFH